MLLPLLIDRIKDLRRSKVEEYEAISGADFEMIVTQLQHSSFRFHAMTRLLIPKHKPFLLIEPELASLPFLRIVGIEL